MLTVTMTTVNTILSPRLLETTKTFQLQLQTDVDRSNASHLAVFEGFEPVLVTKATAVVELLALLGVVVVVPPRVVALARPPGRG